MVLNPAGQLIPAGPELERLMSAWSLLESQRDVLRAAGGACALIYRAQGVADERTGFASSSLGLAVLTPLLRLVRRFREPVLSPVAGFHDLGLEDPRCTRVGERYVVYYTGFASCCDERAGRTVRVCAASTDDFLSWELHGRVEHDWGPLPNKNAALLPGPIEALGGLFVLLHRPMAGPDPMAVHWAVSEGPLGPWSTRGSLMRAYRYREFVSSWVGAGGPPLALGEGRFLMIYHLGHFTPEGRREYDLAAALLDFEEKEPVRARIEPLMRPTGLAETEGDDALGVDNVLFTCANYAWRQKLVVPYAGADSRIFGATVDLDVLVEALEARAGSSQGGRTSV